MKGGWNALIDIQKHNELSKKEDMKGREVHGIVREQQKLNKENKNETKVFMLQLRAFQTLRTDSENETTLITKSFWPSILGALSLKLPVNNVEQNDQHFSACNF